MELQRSPTSWAVKASHTFLASRPPTDSKEELFSQHVGGPSVTPFPSPSDEHELPRPSPPHTLPSAP